MARIQAVSLDPRLQRGEAGDQIVAHLERTVGYMLGHGQFVAKVLLFGGQFADTGRVAGREFVYTLHQSAQGDDFILQRHVLTMV